MLTATTRLLTPKTPWRQDLTSALPRRCLARTPQTSAATSSPSIAKCLLVVAVVVSLTSPSDAYFMKCKQLCSMLARKELQQVWCVYNMCRNEKLGRHILRYAKRSWKLSPLSGHDSLLDDAPLATRQTPGLGGEGERGLGQRAHFLQTIAKAREELGGRRALPPVEAKRDVEYWDGPAPADMNA